MDPEDPFARMDPETIRRGSLRTLRAMFPELFASEAESETEAQPQGQSAEHLAPVEEDEDGDPHSDENGMTHTAGSSDG